jgi:bla regulator protein BlaR1
MTLLEINMEYVTNLYSIAVWFFITSLKATVVIALIMIIRFLFRDRLPAKWQHALWLLLVVRLVLPDIQSPLSLFNYTPNLAPQPIQIDRPEMSIDHNNISIQSPVDYSPSAIETNFEAGIQKASLNTIEILALIWLAGVIALFGYAAIAYIRQFLQLKRAVRVRDEHLIELLNHCSKVLSVSPHAQILLSDDVLTPMSCGIFKPTIVLPKKLFSELSSSQLEHIFLHELAHFKRLDLPIALLMTILQTFYWFNPFVWVAFFLMSQDREAACDELVLNKIGSQHSLKYGQTLISLLRHRAPRLLQPVAVSLADDKSNLKRRVTMISNFSPKSVWWSVIAATLFIVIAVFALTSAEKMEKNYHSKWQAMNDKNQIFRLYFDSELGETISGEYHQEDTQYITYFEGKRIKQNQYKLNMIADILGTYESLLSEYTLDIKDDQIILTLDYGETLGTAILIFERAPLTPEDRSFLELRAIFENIIELRLEIKKHFVRGWFQDEEKAKAMLPLIREERVLVTQQLNQIHSKDLQSKVISEHLALTLSLWQTFQSPVDSLWVEKLYTRLPESSLEYYSWASTMHRIWDYQVEDYKAYYSKIMDKDLPTDIAGFLLFELKWQHIFPQQRDKMAKDGIPLGAPDEHEQRLLQMVRESPELMQYCDARIEELHEKFPDNENLKMAYSFLERSKK